MRNIFGVLFTTVIFFMSCTSDNTSATDPSKKSVKLVTLDPGHFHAALVQKSMYPEVDSVVHVYAPQGNDLQFHLDRVDGYNTRGEDPTKWKDSCIYRR